MLIVLIQIQTHNPGKLVLVAIQNNFVGNHIALHEIHHKLAQKLKQI